MTEGLSAACLLCEGGPINSGSWPFHKLQYMLHGVPQGRQSGRSTSEYYCLLYTNKKDNVVDRYLAQSYVFTMLNNTLNTFKETATSTYYVLQRRCSVH